MNENSDLLVRSKVCN